MFLVKIFRYSKPLFFVILSFTTMQLFIFYKHGMTITPWLNYGMFSGKMGIQKEYSVYGLQGKYSPLIHWLSPQRDTRVMSPLIWYHYQTTNNSFVKEKVIPISSKFMLRLSPSPYYINVDEKTFKNWYYSFASDWIHLPAKEKFNLNPHRAIWKENKLIFATTQFYE